MKLVFTQHHHFAFRSFFTFRMLVFGHNDICCFHFVSCTTIEKKSLWTRTNLMEPFVKCLNALKHLTHNSTNNPSCSEIVLKLIWKTQTLSFCVCPNVAVHNEPKKQTKNKIKLLRKQINTNLKRTQNERFYSCGA